MGITSTEVKQRWENKAYKKIMVRLRYDEDQEIIDFIEKHKEKYGTTAIFRDALTMLMKSGELD